MKKKNNNSHIIISIDADKTFDRIQHPSMIKTLTKLGIEKNLLNLVKGIYEKPTASVILNGEIQNAFLLRSGTW